MLSFRTREYDEGSRINFSVQDTYENRMDLSCDDQAQTNVAAKSKHYYNWFKNDDE